MGRIPERLPVAGGIKNRRQEIHDQKNNPCRKTETAVIQAFQEFVSAAEANLDLFKANRDASIARMIFQIGDPTGLRYAETLLHLSSTIARAEAAKLCPNHQDWVKQSRERFSDLYTNSQSGISLNELEDMQLPLTRENIAKIGKLFHNSLFSFSHMNKVYIRKIMADIVLQPLINPERAMDEQLHPIRDRLVAFFEFYKPFITEEYVPPGQEGSFIITYFWLGEDFRRSLGLYIAADSGLSPSSIIKLFCYRIRPFPAWLAQNKFINLLESYFNDAYPTSGINATPKLLQRYLAYDAKADTQATKLLYHHYIESPAPQDLANMQIDHITTEELLAQYTKRYRNLIRVDSFQDPNRYLRIPFTNHPVFQEVIACFKPNKSRHKNNSLFILSFQDGTHLTLEMDKESRRLYGIPPQLLKSSFHINDLLIRDIIGTLVKDARRKHPDQGKSQIITIDSLFRERFPTHPPIYIKVTEESAKPKRKQNERTSTAIIAFNPPEVPEPIIPRRREFYVEYTADLVADKLRVKVNNQLVGRTMRTILAFEYGDKPFKRLESDSSLFSVRQGDYRIIFRYTGGSRFIIDRIGNRDKVYDD